MDFFHTFVNTFIHYNMDYWERLFLYNKKLLMPRVNQLLNWVMGLIFLCGIVFFTDHCV